MKHLYQIGVSNRWHNSRNLLRATAVGLSLTFATIFGVFSNQASAQTVNFSGNIAAPNACIIVVLSDGTLAPNAAGTQLSSKNPGGVGGTANVFSFTNYRLWLDPPTFFTLMPPGFDDSGVAFSTLFSGTSIFRGRNFTDRRGTSPTRLRRGFSITRITADLIADNPFAFSTGNYASYATLRCE